MTDHFSAPQERLPLDAVLAVRDEVGKVVVGQQGVLTGSIAALLVNGHVLLEGVPGVAKTLLAKSLAAAFDMEFTRVQFTPDLMPSDVIGQQMVAQQPGGQVSFTFRQGPVFTNLL
ncbi:MAG: AAA family ATPase, partial [Ilumatobacter sp.]|nr:AAA family ATPase [Ilumatobacter sp.]